VTGVRLLVVGDALLDRDVEGTIERLAPEGVVPVVDQERVRLRPGGAGLAAALAARDGHAVTLVTALARDDAGRELRAALESREIELVDLGLDGATPEKIRLRAHGHTLLRLDRGGREGSVGVCTAAARAAASWATGMLIADYGRGITCDPGLRRAVERAADAGVPVVWDPHPRGASPVPGATLCTPNEREAEGFASGSQSAEERARELLARWRAGAVCLTRGAGGALLVRRGAPPLAVPAAPVATGDPCGAGDRFAARAAGVLAAGGDVAEAVAEAVAAATAFVADGGAAAVEDDTWVLPAPEDAGPEALAARMRAQGRTVVATGGCFDLLHPGHVHTLQAARALGDCLIVCLNSDASVRRLKGPGRPIVNEQDRAAVLAALGCVDAVAVFDEATPARLLEQIRPHIWAKGGDYEGRRLPEQEVLERWGGRAVVLPFLDGRSTTELIERTVGHVA
jgi:rfaE bifunctional protein nucleotidyltransferase chain/domain/rfaE bifunctional protein kinase chain/domain